MQLHSSRAGFSILQVGNAFTWGFTSLGGSGLYLETVPSGLKELPNRGADAWTVSLISFTNFAVSVLVALLSVLFPRL